MAQMHEELVMSEVEPLDTMPNNPIIGECSNKFEQDTPIQILKEED